MADNAQMAKLREAYYSRKPAEKFIIAGVLIAGLVLSYLTFVSDPLQAEVAVLQQQLTTTNSRLATMRTREEQAERRSQEDPNRAARERLEVVLRELNAAQAQVNALAGSMVSPVVMNRLLTDVLDNQTGLRLLSVQNRPPQRLGEAQATTTTGQTAARQIQRIYRHGLTLEFEGDFLSTLQYLVYLENLSENFYWDSLIFSPIVWPTTRITLDIHTLSLEESFIGV